MICLLMASVAPSIVAAQQPSVEWRRAIDRDDAATLHRLFEQVPVEISNEKGKNALMSAAKLGDFDLFDKLIAADISVTDRSRTGGTVLMYAVLGNQREMVRYLLTQPGDIDAQSTNGWTAFMIAAAKGFTDMAEVLADAGADINLADAYRWSPLMRSIDNRHTRVAEYIARLTGIRLNHQNENNATALHIAAATGNLQLVDLLLEKQIDTELVNHAGHAAIDVARQAGHRDVVRLLAKQ